MILKRLVFASLFLLALASCDSSKERAQKHYESAVALLAAGDVDRAMVELRNVFKYDDGHRDGRLLMARTLRERGDQGGAFGQYLKLVELDPGDAEALKALAEIAYAAADPKEARLRVDAALAALPADPGLQAMDAALDYQTAAAAGDTAAEADALSRAQALIGADPALLPARQVVISDLIRAQDWEKALAEIDAALAIDETPRGLHAARLAVLDQFGDKAGVEAELKRMVELFPDDEAVGGTLVRWYIGEKRLDDAEAWLRGRVVEGSDDPAARLTLIRFLAELRGTDAALAELDRVLALAPAPTDVAGHLAQYRALHAGFNFTAGKQDAAIAEMEALVAAAQPSDDTNRLKVALAQMRAATGNQVGARALVEEVLVADPAQVEALKLKGGWLVDDDRTDDAVATLREAANVAPRDPQVMTLLALAYERQGNRDLVGQMLSQATEASNAAPAESLRYAGFLMQGGDLSAAEAVLVAALRLDTANLQVLAMLTQVHIAMQDWPRSESDIARLRQLEGAEAAAAADEMQARLLAGRGDTDALSGFLEGLAATGSGGLRAEAAVIRNQAAAGRLDEAETRARSLAAAHPDDASARFLLGAVLAMAGKNGEAETELRAAAAAAPALEAAWTALFDLRYRQDDLAGAAAVLDEAQKALPDSARLQWLRAGLLERQGDVEGAIAIYEAMYARDSSNAVIANNLGSLLASTRDDGDSLERAWTVVRRLNGTEVPAFADTYGWIAFRRGDAAAALPYLELAAKGLPEDPTVHYHLGSVYAALKRPDEARAAFEESRRRITAQAPGIPGLGGLIDGALAGLGAN
jgi:Flp pilus assembly protein TadD